jgi:tetratricopeptide (TPR) repeat protein
VLSLVVAVFVGFLAGKNSAASAKLSERPQKYEEVVATPETESLLEAGFVHLNGGDFRKAFLDFQKALQGQPSLPGIDYLVGYSALHSGEYSLAKEALDHAVSKNEMEGESRVLLALISLDESTNEKNASTQMTDPLVTAESEFRRYASTHPKSAWIYSRWAEIHRQRGSYRTAADLLHKAVLRADPDENLSLLAAREVLNKLQNQPAKETPSTATITSMRGDEALGAALAALQNKSSSDAVLFLERAKEFYSPRVFREIASDKAFDEYRADAKVMKILEGTSMKSAQP